jgi:hypothetical protein
MSQYRHPNKRPFPSLAPSSPSYIRSIRLRLTASTDAPSVPAGRALAYDAFTPDIDAPFLNHLEFSAVLSSEMAPLLSSTPSLGGPPGTATRTRAQWRCIRRKMCLVFPAGCARPRRLSTRFLAAERNELARYREDARAVLRGRPLDKGVDEASGVPLGRLWWHRYPFEIPLPPKRGAVVFVKSGDGFALPAGEKRKQGAVTARASAVSKGAPGNGGRVRGQPENVTFYQGKFLSVAPNGKVTIHVDRTSCASSPHVVVTVPDLNVMSVVEPAMPVESPRCSAPVQPVTSQPSAPLGDAQDASENTISASATVHTPFCGSDRALACDSSCSSCRSRCSR